MTDLTRRSFIKNIGITGTATFFCGSVVAQNTLENFSNLEKDENNILSKFSKITLFDAFLIDQPLYNCYKKSILNWEKTGYAATGNFCYSSSDRLLKMFPIHLHTDQNGKLDNVLLCFGKDTKGEWKVLRSLSGFDLEAITVAMNDLKIHADEVNLSHYLFPAPIQEFNPYGFNTKKGSVSLQTLLAQEQTSTKIIVKEGSTIVYEKEIVSQHLLSINSVLV